MSKTVLKLWLVSTVLWGLFLINQNPIDFKDAVIYSFSERQYAESIHARDIDNLIYRLEDFKLNPKASSIPYWQSLYGGKDTSQKNRIDSIIELAYPTGDISKEVFTILGYSDPVDKAKIASTDDAIEKLKLERLEKKNLRIKTPSDIYNPFFKWLEPSAWGLLFIFGLAFIGIKSPTIKIGNLTSVYKALSPGQQLGMPIVVFLVILCMLTALILDYTSPTKSCIRKVLAAYGDENNPDHISEANKICIPSVKLGINNSNDEDVKESLESIEKKVKLLAIESMDNSIVRDLVTVPRSLTCTTIGEITTCN